MAKDDPESRPIPVSELLARRREEAAATEETGEIPRVAFPRSANPVPQRAARPQADTAAASISRTASGMPAYTPVQPAASPAQPQVDDEANRVTGVIPTVEPAVAKSASAEPAPQPEQSDPATGSFLRSDDDVDFESYRNFDDIVEEEPQERKRGLFGRKRDKGKRDATAHGKGDRARAQRRESATESGATTAARAPEPAVEEVDTRAVRAASAQEYDTEVVEVVETGVPSGPTALAGETEMLAPVAADDLYEDEIPVVSQPLVDPFTGRFVAPQNGGASRSAHSTREAEKDDDGPAIVPSVTRRTHRSEDVTQEETPKPRKQTRQHRQDRQQESDTAIVDEEPLASRHSPTMQWVIVIGQALAGLLVGAAGFWGFVQLWRWNVYFALVLSAVVIFGIVTLVHLVRRRHDLSTTLLALGVGLIITLGPLILLATS
ncbi:hypothetical protein GOARA_045_00300 [Gordonia araii NBRC 100433]|uniref:Transmembrane protein n=1 Tax=Gordonia araii NBRC 100433 TaxID=1073574 RepID=G7H1F1_9ACTN|nr:hypothetical protein [Gordonia araii]NNG97815.1 hypothetical protein [Gordonia araii NBRC 100433]GAB09676.1 hypothetical protein GOARA_045_00300 [Gordonia araii NBRC 100433]